MKLTILFTFFDVFVICGETLSSSCDYNLCFCLTSVYFVSYLWVSVVDFVFVVDYFQFGVVFYFQRVGFS